jgi:hypothetical protein
MHLRLYAALGVALTTFLAVAVLLTEALSARIAFSAAVGLPVGAACGLVAGFATRTRLWRRRAARSTLLAVATSGYALLAAAALSYSVPPVRGVVRTATAVPFAAACAVAAALLARRYPERVE